MEVFFVLFWDCVREYYYVCYSRNYTVKTMKNKEQEFNQFKKWVDKINITKLDEVTTEVLQEYHTDKLKKGLKPQSIISTSKQIRAFFNWCVSVDYLKENPMGKVELPKVSKQIIEAFSSQEVYKLIECSSYKNYIEARNKLIIAIMVDTGVRVTELTNMKEDHIGIDKIYVLGKGRKERYLSISPVLKRIMIRYDRLKNQYFEDKMIKDDYYILNYRGHQMSNTGLWLVCKKAGKRTKIKDVHPHKFRHYFAITSLKVGKIDIHSLSLLLGHSDIATTEIYLRSFRNDDLLHQAKSSSPLMNMHKDKKKN